MNRGWLNVSRGELGEWFWTYLFQTGAYFTHLFPYQRQILGSELRKSTHRGTWLLKMKNIYTYESRPGMTVWIQTFLFQKIRKWEGGTVHSLAAEDSVQATLRMFVIVSAMFTALDVLYSSLNLCCIYSSRTSWSCKIYFQGSASLKCGFVAFCIVPLLLPGSPQAGSSLKQQHPEDQQDQGSHDQPDEIPQSIVLGVGGCGQRRHRSHCRSQSSRIPDVHQGT